MSGTVLVASLGLVAAILCFFFWKLGGEDSGNKYPLQIIIFGFILGIILLLGKVGVDYKDNCDWLVANSTVSGSITSYDYEYTCSENTNTTSTTFYGVAVWIARLTTAYLVLAFGFELISYFGGKKRGEGQ